MVVQPKKRSHVLQFDSVYYTVVSEVMRVASYQGYSDNPYWLSTLMTNAYIIYPI